MLILTLGVSIMKPYKEELQYQELKKWNLVNLIAQDENKSVIRFTETNAIGPHWAYFSVSVPITNERQSCSLNGRIQLKNTNVYGIRLRIEAGNSEVRNAWINFNQTSEKHLSTCDDGISIWFVDKQTVIVDFSLTGLKGMLISIGVMTFDKDFSVDYVSKGREFSVEKIDYKYTVETSNSQVTYEKHSKDFAGKAVELCKGLGIEIGALHRPMPLDAQVIYLDHYKTEELRRTYAGDPRVSAIRQVHVAWNDGRYPFFDDNAFNFVINSHVLEHVANPGKQIEEWLRIIQPGGILYMIVPDKNYCFDRRREVTTVKHLLYEYANNISEITIEHYEDFITNTNGEDGISRDVSIEAIQCAWEAQGSIHVHTFEPSSIKSFLKKLSPKIGFDFIYFEAKGLNMHCALKKL